MSQQQQFSFSSIASGIPKKADFNAADFPALTQDLTKSQREEILMSNLLGNSQTKPKKQTKRADKEKFGLLGLIDVIRMTNPDLSMMSLGCDLTTLGLDLNSVDSVYTNFMTPFSDTPLGQEPSFPPTSSYVIHNMPDPLTKIQNMSDETLFYIFYACPRDLLQEAASQELYARNWRFHKEFKLWLTRTDSKVEKGSDFERGVYVFFDPSSWSRVKKEWILYFDQLEERNEGPESWLQDGSIFQSMNEEMSQMEIK